MRTPSATSHTVTFVRRRLHGGTLSASSAITWTDRMATNRLSIVTDTAKDGATILTIGAIAKIVMLGMMYLRTNGGKSYVPFDRIVSVLDFVTLVTCTQFAIAHLIRSLTGLVQILWAGLAAAGRGKGRRRRSGRSRARVRIAKLPRSQKSVVDRRGSVDERASISSSAVELWSRVVEWLRPRLGSRDGRDKEPLPK
jgi:hypothetical protein